MKMTYRRGDIFTADLGIGVGSEQQGVRPVIVVQNDIGNNHSPTVIVAPMTTQGPNKRSIPTHYSFETVEGFNEPSTVLLEQIRTIDKQRLFEKIGQLTDTQMREIEQRLLISLGFILPKEKTMELCLCRKCLEDFINTRSYRIKRKYDYQLVKETCTFCNHRKGLDYMLISKNVSYPEKKLVDTGKDICSGEREKPNGIQ